jgi:hypothetical protein
MFRLMVIIATLLGCVGMATAQQVKKVPRIGYLVGGDPASESTRAEAIRLALTRTWLRRRTEHRHRVPIYGGEGRSVP